MKQGREILGALSWLEAEGKRRWKKKLKGDHEVVKGAVAESGGAAKAVVAGFVGGRRW